MHCTNHAFDDRVCDVSIAQVLRVMEVKNRANHTRLAGTNNAGGAAAAANAAGIDAAAGVG